MLFNLLKETKIISMLVLLRQLCTSEFYKHGGNNQLDLSCQVFLSRMIELEKKNDTKIRM